MTKVSLLTIGIACLLGVGVRAETLFTGPGSPEQWQVKGGGKVQFGEGQVTITAATEEANPTLVTTSRFELKSGRSWVLSVKDIRYAVSWNHQAAPIEIKLGSVLSINLTTWGEGGCIVIGKEVIPLSLYPVMGDGASIELQYDATQRQLILRQTGGRIKQGKAMSDVSATKPRVLVEKSLNEPLQFDESVPLIIAVRSQYNGGIAKPGCQVGEIRLETQN